MARTLIVLVLIAGAAYFIYQRTSSTATEEEQLVAHLSDRYTVVLNKFTGAAGRSGAIGTDTTMDSETAVAQMLRIRDEVAELRRRLTEEKAIRKAAELADKIEYFCRKNDIIRP